MTIDQVAPAAIVVVLLILVVVGSGRALSRRRGANEDAFGAGGTATVSPGEIGTAKTDLSPSGVVQVVGEQWTASSQSGATIPSGSHVRVVGQDGLRLIVVADPAGEGTGE